MLIHTKCRTLFSVGCVKQYLTRCETNSRELYQVSVHTCTQLSQGWSKPLRSWTLVIICLQAKHKQTENKSDISHLEIQPGLWTHSSTLLGRSISCSVGIMIICSLLAFPCSVSLTSSHIHVASAARYLNFRQTCNCAAGLLIVHTPVLKAAVKSTRVKLHGNMYVT